MLLNDKSFVWNSARIPPKSKALQMRVEALCFQPAHRSLFNPLHGLPRALRSFLELWVGQEVGGERDRNLSSALQGVGQDRADTVHGSEFISESLQTVLFPLSPDCVVAVSDPSEILSLNCCSSHQSSPFLGETDFQREKHLLELILANL